MKTCMDCVWFSSSCETGKPILDECICLKQQGGKNIFADIEICEDFEEKPNHIVTLTR